MKASVAVETVRSLDGAAAVECEWDALLQRARSATPFQSPAWLLPWYAVWAPDRLYLLIARDCGGAPLAIVPGVRCNGRVELAGGGISDYLAPVVDSAAADAAGAALNLALAGSQCVFANVPADPPWPVAADGAGWQVSSASVCPVIRLPATVDAWRETLPSGLRRNLRRYGSRMVKDAGAAFRTVECEEELGPALDALVRLHGRRWDERACPGVLADREVQRFHALSAPHVFRKQMLRLHLLCAGPSVVAAQYVLVAGSRAFGYIGGFDPAWRKYSPGALLLAYAIERAIDEGCIEFDLLRGTESYKYSWGAVNRTTLCFTR